MGIRFNISAILVFLAMMACGRGERSNLGVDSVEIEAPSLEEDVNDQQEKVVIVEQHGVETVSEDELSDEYQTILNKVNDDDPILEDDMSTVDVFEDGVEDQSYVEYVPGDTGCLNFFESLESTKQDIIAGWFGDEFEVSCVFIEAFPEGQKSVTLIFNLDLWENVDTDTAKIEDAFELLHLDLKQNLLKKKIAKNSKLNLIDGKVVVKIKATGVWKLRFVEPPVED